MKKICSITGERYEQIKEIVADMYEDLGYTELPVNVFELCHKLNIKLIRYSSLSEDCYEYSRQFSKDGFNLFNINTSRIRFTTTTECRASALLLPLCMR